MPPPFQFPNPQQAFAAWPQPPVVSNDMRYRQTQQQATDFGMAAHDADGSAGQQQWGNPPYNTYHHVQPPPAYPPATPPQWRSNRRRRRIDDDDMHDGVIDQATLSRLAAFLAQSAYTAPVHAAAPAPAPVQATSPVPVQPQALHQAATAAASAADSLVFSGSGGVFVVSKSLLWTLAFGIALLLFIVLLIVCATTQRTLDKHVARMDTVLQLLGQGGMLFQHQFLTSKNRSRSRSRDRSRTRSWSRL